MDEHTESTKKALAANLNLNFTAVEMFTEGILKAKFKIP